MKNLPLLFVLPAFLFLIYACRGATTGPEFVGKWQDIANPTTTLDISSAGDRYVLNLHDTTGEHNYIANLNDHTLTVTVGDTISKKITYQENSDTLEWEGTAYKRAQ